MCNPLALVAGGTSIVSGIMGSNAAKKQAKDDRKAAAANAAANLAAVNDFKKNDPFAQLGGDATGQMKSLMGYDGSDPTEALRKTPGYEFMFKEGMDALQHSLGANNSLYSGKAMKEITKYGQGMADQTYNAAFDRNLSLMNGASGSASTVLQSVTGTNNNLASDQIGANATRAGATQSLIDGISGAAGAITGAMGKKSVANPAPTTPGASVSGVNHTQKVLTKVGGI